MTAVVTSKARTKQKQEQLDVNVIVQIKGLKKQKQHNGKYGVIVQHKLNTTSNRHRVRLLEDDESNQPTQQTMILNSFGMTNDNNKSQSSPAFKHVYIKDINLFPLCKIDKSTVHKDGIVALKPYKSGDIIYSDIPLLTCPGFSLLWKTDSSNQITRLWEIYCSTNKIKKAYFSAILHFDNTCMVYNDVTRSMNKLSMEPTFKIRYLCADEIPDEVKGKLNEHLRTGFQINQDKQSAFDFTQWCKIITIFKLNAINDTAYYVASKLNHACSPNVCITAEGKVMAIRDIKPGEELFVSYLKRDASLYKYQQLRSLEIQRTKGFRCKCIRCETTYDDARNFKCQNCTTGKVTWNANSSRLYTKCDNSECGRFPNVMNQKKFMSIEKKLSVFLLENTGDMDVSALKMRRQNGSKSMEDEKEEDAKSKLSDEIKGLLDEAQRYLNEHYLLIALYHRLCQLNLHMDWLRLRYHTMCGIYKWPNDCLLRASVEYHRFIPLLCLGDIVTGNAKKEDAEKQQIEMNALQSHIEDMKSALGLNIN
eukprot:86434_1